MGVGAGRAEPKSAAEVGLAFFAAGSFLGSLAFHELFFAFLIKRSPT
jgi:hypothetical protein